MTEEIEICALKLATNVNIIAIFKTLRFQLKRVGMQLQP